jgi:hypothetical protein
MGSYSIIVSSALILLAMELGGKEGWGSPIIISFFILGPLMVGVFVWWEIKHAREPVIPMHLFRIPNFTFSIIVSFLGNVPFYATAWV